MNNKPIIIILLLVIVGLLHICVYQNSIIGKARTYINTLERVDILLPGYVDSISEEPAYLEYYNKINSYL